MFKILTMIERLLLLIGQDALTKMVLDAVMIERKRRGRNCLRNMESHMEMVILSQDIVGDDE